MNEKLAKEIAALILANRFVIPLDDLFYIALFFDVRDCFVDGKFFLNHLSFASSRLDRIHLRLYNEYSERETLR